MMQVGCTLAHRWKEASGLRFPRRSDGRVGAERPAEMDACLSRRIGKCSLSMFPCDGIEFSFACAAVLHARPITALLRADSRLASGENRGPERCTAPALLFSLRRERQRA